MKALIVTVSLLVPSLTFAENILIHVDGMVCGFCSQGLTKSFNKEESVEKVDVDLDKKVVALKTKEGTQLNDERIGAIITDAGFKLRSIERK